MDTVLNEQGMELRRVGAGSFHMGGGDAGSNPDALPVHKVTLTEAYYMAKEPVTHSLFVQYETERYGKAGSHEQYMGYVIGVSFWEAEDYVRWLSDREHKSYYLPTEAQWEYAARQNPELGIDRMCDPCMREWCYDWYAPYGDREAEDPAGPVNGIFRCIRGGYLDNPERYNEFPRDPFYRCALPPDYRHYEEDKANAFGRHLIGFRVVMGAEPVPEGKQLPVYTSVGVRQETEAFRCAAPPSHIPYFRKRYLFPVPPDNCTAEEIRSVGFSPLFRHHHHSPGFTAALNGDLLYSVYSTYHEYDAPAGLVGARFRIGEDEWGYPDEFMNPVGVNDHAPLLYTGRDGTIYHFWGWQQLNNAFPFQYMESKDNGETWGPVKFPLFRDKAEDVTSQPVNSCVEGSDGTFYLVSDASTRETVDDTGVQCVGAASVLWRSRDGLRTWENPLSRTAGRHTAAVELKDGSILALGGKNTDIDGYMPAAVTKDGGDSYQVYKTCFPAMNSGQRPSILRLSSGKLAMCGDYQTKRDVKPGDMQNKAGSYVAWSDDEGVTWHFKQLWGTQRRKRSPEQFGGASTIGYSVMKQSPDGLIHLVCSNVHPLLHLCFNEAWLLSEESPEPDEKILMASGATRLKGERQEYTEHYSGTDTLKCRYFGGIADDGRFLLDGPEVFYYPDGRVMTEGGYRLGKRTGTFTYYDPEGNPVKRFTCPDTEDGESREVFETFYPGTKAVRTKALFCNRKVEGYALSYDREGNETKRVLFRDGKTENDFSLLEQ